MFGFELPMHQEDKPDLISARLTRVTWWRAALARLGLRPDRAYHETLDRFAQRKADDSLGEEDVKSWLAALESGTKSSQKPGKRR